MTIQVGQQSPAWSRAPTDKKTIAQGGAGRAQLVAPDGKRPPQPLRGTTPQMVGSVLTIALPFCLL